MQLYSIWSSDHLHITFHKHYFNHNVHIFLCQKIREQSRLSLPERPAVWRLLPLNYSLRKAHTSLSLAAAKKARQSSQRYRQACHWRSGQCRQSLRPRSAVRDSQKREGPYRHHLC